MTQGNVFGREIKETPDKTAEMATRLERANLILGKRWNPAEEGDVQKYDRGTYRFDGQSWIEVTGEVEELLYRLNGGTRLWRSDATRHIGMRLVKDIVDAARREASSS